MKNTPPRIINYKNGIILKYTMTDTPQQNGTAERTIRTTLNKIRTKLPS